MSWVKYIYFKKANIAIDCGKMDYNDIIEGSWVETERFIEYMNEEEPKFEVINYLWNRVFATNTIDLTFNILLDYLGLDYEVINEEELEKLKDVRVLSRG